MNAAAAWQLGWGLLIVLIMLLLASGPRRTVAIGALLVLIPFQFVDTRYASSSILMAYALAAVLVLNGGFLTRMLPAIGLIVLAYLISLSQASRELMFDHVLFTFQFFSCLLVFLLAYNFSRLVERERSVVDLLLAMNVLVIGYSLLQMSAGPGERFVPFGIEAFEFNPNRHAGDARLVGPFANPGSTAGYFMLMSLVCIVEFMFSTARRRQLILFLIVANLLGIVATGNRTNLLVLAATFPMLLLLYRRELGPRRVASYAMSGAAVFLVAAGLAVAYTDFGVMFERLGRLTETEDGVPSTRVLTWPVAIEKIGEAPWLGEGPFFVHPEAAEREGQARVQFDDDGGITTAYDPYPHSLYLYLLRTVGFIGLVAVLTFFMRAWLILLTGSGSAKGSRDNYTSALVRLGIVIIPAFMVSQITLEFSRPATMDYGHFVFGLIGLLIGVGDRSIFAHRSIGARSIKGAIRDATAHRGRAVGGTLS